MRLPTFQRPLKWTPEDRLALFDSIDRGYPIGTLLFWRSETKAGRVEWFETSRDVPARPDAMLVVDGQQRVAALAAALLAPEPRLRERQLVFDLVDARFRWSRASRDADSKSPCVPARVLLDATDLGVWVNENRLDRAHAREAFSVGKRLREYSVPAYVVDAEHEDALRHVFERINNTGKSLTRGEVFDAMLATRELDAPGGVQGVVSDLTALGFGEVDTDVVLSCMEAVLGLTIGSIKAKNFEPESAVDVLLRTRDALASAIAFLQRECAIPRVEWLPYNLPLVVLARFFDAFPRPTTRSLTLLRRWFWRGSLAGRLSGASRSLQEHVREVRAEDESGSVQRLMQHSGKRSLLAVAPQALVPSFNVAHAHGKLELCALASMRPRHLEGGEQISTGGALGPPPEALMILEAEPSNDHQLRSTLANRILHPHVTGRRAARLILGCDDVGALASHCITPESRHLLAERKHVEFFATRYALLNRTVEAFFERMAEWRSEDGPAVSQLRLGGL